MTAPELVVTMTACGVTFTVVGDRLRVEAPAGELSESDWNILAAHKVALIALLAPIQESEGSPPEPGSKTTGATVADAMEVFPGSLVVAVEHPAAWPPEGGTSRRRLLPRVPVSRLPSRSVWCSTKPRRPTARALE